MATERQLHDSLTRCVAAMVHYNNMERSVEAFERMTAEIQLVAGFLDELGLSAEAVETSLFRPLEAELTSRFGPEVGRRLAAEVVRAFEGLKAIKATASRSRRRSAQETS